MNSERAIIAFIWAGIAADVGVILVSSFGEPVKTSGNRDFIYWSLGIAAVVGLIVYGRAKYE